MILAYSAALGAALCWAVGGLISIGPVRALGAMTFNRLRMAVVFVMLALAASALGGWKTLAPEQLVLLALSGATGILIGDTLLFSGLKRLGPRRNTVLFATNAPMAALLGYLVLDEPLRPQGLFGIALITAGVMLAILFGRRRNAAPNPFEDLQGGLSVGVLMVLGAALCQALGTVIAKPVMAAGADPVAASAVRVGVSLVGLAATALLPGAKRGAPVVLTPRLLGGVALSAVVGMGIGMTLLLLALAHGKAGIVATLSATSPVMILPLLWLRTGEAPALPAWIGAALTVGGIALIFLR